MTKYKRSVVIFRRDLRTFDNTALNAALGSSEEVIPCFIFNDAQVGPHPYRSDNGLCFMIESLEELASNFSENEGTLFFLHGDPADVVSRLIAAHFADAVFVNKDYTPFSRERDRAISEACEKAGAKFHSFSDLLLVEPSEFGKSNGAPYAVFTPFHNRASSEEIRAPAARIAGRFFRGPLALGTVEPRSYWPEASAIERAARGGRSEGSRILEEAKRWDRYKDRRDLPAVQGTSMLAPHNKFGTVSIREVYWRIRTALGAGHDLLRQLFWRDFFTHIAWHFPHVFSGPFNRTYENLEWSGDDECFDAWKNGRTGFPIVDAGMRQLVRTGFMHNRVRMIVASFLVKDLLIDWRAGESFFAQHLTEYDPAVNNGSWQWGASTGCDAQPYFRIFNPWLQQKRFDPSAEYIKHWVPELEGLSPKHIHTLGDSSTPLITGYPTPIVDHKRQKMLAEQMFKVVRGTGPDLPYD